MTVQEKIADTKKQIEETKSAYRKRDLEKYLRRLYKEAKWKA